MDALYGVILGYTACQRELPDTSDELWGDQTLPSVDMIKAKLVRYSSNLYSVTRAYPETAMESNMDYDLRQYLTFLHAYLKVHDLNLMTFVQDYIDQF